MIVKIYVSDNLYHSFTIEYGEKVLICMCDVTFKRLLWMTGLCIVEDGMVLLVEVPNFDRFVEVHDILVKFYKNIPFVYEEDYSWEEVGYADCDKEILLHMIEKIFWRHT